MKYPKYLSKGNWLFVHIEADPFEKNPVGGAIPNNLYIDCFGYSGVEFNLNKRYEFH